jgi:hypothetical protein
MTDDCSPIAAHFPLFLICAYLRVFAAGLVFSLRLGAFAFVVQNLTTIPPVAWK